MTSCPFLTVDVFTSKRFGGNPLAVFPDARGLSSEDMQALAGELNLSETAFVLPPDDPANTARVRIFTPVRELPFAGHPNVGTGYVLAQQHRDSDGVLRFEELAGLVEVTVERTGTGEPKAATVAAPQPLTFGSQVSPAAIAACAGLQPADVLTAMHPPIQVSVGNAILVAEVAPSALARATPEVDQFRQAHAESPSLTGLYLYARDGARIRARMFAPLAGILEDPATGSAAASLAGLLLSLTKETSAAYEIVQGVEMGRPSLLRTTARREADAIRATVGGDCVPVLRGEALL